MRIMKYRAEEGIMDQKRALEDSCRSQCTKAYVDYQQCSRRVEGDESGQKHCTGQFFDYWACIDKCVAPKLFQELK
ncbi:UNVERIFIED_CONTAM: Cytochrome b-c1 complex subunit-1, mitochondrial [Sesamum radiatum]|uniref:Cytochrome b-c1 complex subunit 6 n=1 Tax=Sesamum radiatum TaxID=300843 RepID=A0AAW2QEC3_SESRA